MARKRKHDEHEDHVNHEAWIIPYADLLTLLMGLFLVLWALGKTDMERAAKVAQGFQAELGVGGGSLGGGSGASVSAEGSTDTNAEAATIVDLKTRLGKA